MRQHGHGLGAGAGKMEPVQEEGDVSEVFLSLGPPEEALEARA